MVDVNDLFDLDELLTVEKLLVLVGGLLLTISIFFNYMQIDGDDADDLDTNEWKGTEADDIEDDTEDADEDIKLINPYFTMIFGILAILIGIIPRNFEMAQGFMGIVLVVIGVIAGAMVFMNYGEINDFADDVNDVYDEFEIDAEVKVGLGIWLGFIGALLVIVGGALCFVFKEDDKWIRLKK
jgi:hypothetical protein